MAESSEMSNSDADFRYENEISHLVYYKQIEEIRNVFLSDYNITKK